MTRILFVDHTPFVGGGQLVLASHIAALNKTKFDVHVACTDDVPELPERFSHAGAVVHTLPMSRLRGNPFMGIVKLLHSSWRLRALIKEQHIDLVVANTSRASYITSMAVIGTSVPCIWIVRDFLYNKRLFDMLYRIPKKIVGVSKAIVEWYMPIGDPKAIVLYVVSDLYKDLQLISQQDVSNERHKYGFGDDDFVVGYMGRIVEEKGAQDVALAVETLSEQYPQLKLLIVGTGNGQENNIEPQLRSVVEEKGLSSIIQFAGYQLNQALYYSMFDLFVLATRDHEAFATSVVQAMQAGVPVIGTSVGGTPEIIIDQQTGLLYTPGDTAALTAAISKVMSDKTLVKLWTDAARQKALALNEEDLARKSEEIYIESVKGLD